MFLGNRNKFTSQSKNNEILKQKSIDKLLEEKEKVVYTEYWFLIYFHNV